MNIYWATKSRLECNFWDVQYVVLKICVSDVNKDLSFKDKDETLKDQEKDQDKNQTSKAKDQDKD